MGTNIRDLCQPETISLEQLKGKTLVVDSFNLFFQFLTSIRTRDGTELRDSHGNITSILIGLQSRIPKLLAKGIKLAFVLDGTPPPLKQQERDRRKGLKVLAKTQFERAKIDRDIDAMKKYASRTASLTGELISDATELLRAYGCPIIQAPSEGEAQAATIAAQGKAYAVVSQDFDSLLHGAPRVIRNLNLSQQRRQGAFTYHKISQEMITLNETLNRNNITREQLIILAMLVGTDYNYGGIKGLGPKKALKIIHEHKDPEKIFAAAEWDESSDIPWPTIYNTIINMKVNLNCTLTWGRMDVDAVVQKLRHHEFSDVRVLEQLKPFMNTTPKEQKGLTDFFH